MIDRQLAHSQMVARMRLIQAIPASTRITDQPVSMFAQSARTELTFSISWAGVKGFWMNGPSAPASVYPDV